MGSSSRRSGVNKPGWYKNLPHFWQEVVDQTLHFILGFVIGALSPLGSIAVCLGREWWQNYGDADNDAIDMLEDISVWTLGAIVASLLF